MPSGDQCSSSSAVESSMISSKTDYKDQVHFITQRLLVDEADVTLMSYAYRDRPANTIIQWNANCYGRFPKHVMIM